MNGPMDDERFDATLRAFLTAEAERTAAAAPPVGETLARLREAGAPSRRALAPAWLLVVLALLLTAALATSLALGSGLIKLSLLVGPSESAVPSPSVVPTLPPALEAAPTSGVDTTPAFSATGEMWPGYAYTFNFGNHAPVAMSLSVPRDTEVPMTAGFGALASGWGACESTPDVHCPVLTTQLPTLVVRQTNRGTEHLDQGAIEFATPEDVYVDPCHRPSGLMGIGPSVDDLVTGLESGLRSVPGLRVSSPTSATVGGLPARRITATDAGDNRLEECDSAEVLLWADPKWMVGTVQAGESSLLNLYVLDVHGTRVLIVTRAESSASVDLAASAASAQVTSILNSIVWPTHVASRPTATAP